jgi:NTE family protein
LSNSNSGNNNNNNNNIITNIPAKERAFLLQGGGSLGAYEAGAYKALYEWLSEKDKKERRKKSSTFDIIKVHWK